MQTINTNVLPTLEDDCLKSGLSSGDVQKLEIRDLTQAEFTSLGITNSPAYLIPYHDINGVYNHYWRVRYLDPNVAPKYLGPRGVPPQLYYPHVAPHVAWAQIAPEPTFPITITEGEKKAARATSMGIHTIAIAGVWAWRAAKHGFSIIPDFNSFNWQGRKVTLCFDNDVHTNKDVMGALFALSRELIKKKARVFIKYLPRTDEKMGLDDYLLKHTAMDWLELDEIEFTELDALHKMNEQVLFVNNTCMVYDYLQQRQYSKDSFTGALYANHHHRVTFEKKKGEIEVKKVSTAKAWVQWEDRSHVEALCYRPGQEQLTTDGNLNLWRGLGVDAEQGDITPFIELMDYLCPDKEQNKWLWQWLAYPLQYLGTKLYTAVLIQSIEQGTGKSFLGAIMGAIYGANFQQIGETELNSDFNAWASGKQFILGEEITGSENRRDADKIKAMITRKDIYINKKYEPEHTMEDFCNYYFTSNHVAAMSLEDKDRRIFVVEVTGAKKSDEFYSNLDTWAWNNGGPQFLLHYLLNNVDTSDFNPRAASPLTEAKVEMVQAGKTEVETFAQSIIESPNSVLLGKPGDLYTIKELCSVEALVGYKYTSLPKLSRALKRLGVPGKRVHIDTERGTERLLAVRNIGKWRAEEDPAVWRAQRVSQFYIPTTLTSGEAPVGKDDRY